MHVVRYVTKHTVEQRILELQEAKRAISAGALGEPSVPVALPRALPRALVCVARLTISISVVTAKLTPEEARRTRLRDLCKLFDGFEAEIAAETRRETLAPPGAKDAHIDADALAEVKKSMPALLVD